MEKGVNMDLKNMKAPIGIIVVIVAQAFGIIWYVAQLDSTVKGLDSSVATIQKSVADTDIAVLQAEVDNLKSLVDQLKNTDVETFDPTEVSNSLTELETEVTWMMDDWGPKIANVDTELDDFDDRLSDIEIVQAIIDNEMRTIMSDHNGFADVLVELQKSGALPSGEKRLYGGYGD